MKLGVDTAAALREAGSDSRNAQAKAVYDKLMPRKAEIRSLYDEIVPKHMQEILKYKPGDGFKTMLEPKTAKLLKTVSGTYYDQFTSPEKTVAATDRRLYGALAGQMAQHLPAAAPAFAGANPAAHPLMTPMHPAGPSWQYHDMSGPYKKALEALGIISTAAAEADTVVRIINPICKEYNHDLMINPAITTGVGAADLVFQVVDCELDAFEDKNPLEGLGCPAMSGSAAFDAARELFTATGVLGDNNPKNGEQGNHEGESSVHEGIFDDSPEGEAVEHSFPMCIVMGKCGLKKVNKPVNKDTGDDDDDDYSGDDDDDSS